MRPRLKRLTWRREGDQLRLVYDQRAHFLLSDPDGITEVLLGLLQGGGRTVAELAREVAASGRADPAADVADLVSLLDEHGLVEDDPARFSPGEEHRHETNLAFFESFSSLARSRSDFQRALRDAHVLVLGTGGLSSTVVPHLCGLGVGRLTLVDRGTVEGRDLNRQYLYRPAEIGARKVEVAAEWVRSYDPDVKVEAVDVDIQSPTQVAELIDQFGPQVAVSSLHSPPDLDRWLNKECVRSRVPYVRGGAWATRGLVLSVEPGRSACLGCRPPPELVPSDDDRAAAELLQQQPRIGRAIGPVAGLLGSLCAFEVLRYLTRFEPPAYAGRPAMVDFAAGCVITQLRWRRDRGCETCGAADPPDGGADRLAIRRVGWR